MIRFNNDYNHGAHASVLHALNQTNDTQYGGYGVDDWCDKAEKLILELAQCPQGKVYFFPGATQANFVTISALLGSVTASSVPTRAISTVLNVRPFKIQATKSSPCPIMTARLRRTRLKGKCRLTIIPAKPNT